MMKMTPHRRAIDKIFKRRDRYDVPEWQREEVWDTGQKQKLIDSILRGWKLPKFYFLKTSEDEYEVVDGQQRLAAIYDFFLNELQLSPESRRLFGGPLYKDLRPKHSDAFDDFEIEYDEIEDADERDLKEFFQRLQNGLPLTSSEKLNSVHSKLRDFCKEQAKHDFFKKSIVVPNTRFSHFDIASKAAVIEVEGVDGGLRFDDIKSVFEDQKAFSTSSSAAKRLRAGLDFLATAFPEREPFLKNRTVVQSIISLACKIVATGRHSGIEASFAEFVRHFMGELTRQVELGQSATDEDFILFQKSINANVKAGARTRMDVLLRKALTWSPLIADAFDTTALAESGLKSRIKEMADSISDEIHMINDVYSAKHGEDLFKTTNRASAAMIRIGKSVSDKGDYVSFISDLYFVFRESIGSRLSEAMPPSFSDVNVLRTDLQHDTDHGTAADFRRKKKKAGSVFERYSGVHSPEALAPERFVLVQAKLLTALLGDLRHIASATE